MERDSTKPVPKTIALGLTKTTVDGRIISINHPNPHGVPRRKKPYRSMKQERAALLPKLYRPRNPHPQHGDFQCPVLNCEKAFTRKAGLLNHMKREGGHLHDGLRDNGDGTFAKLGLAIWHQALNYLKMILAATERNGLEGPPHNISPLPEDASGSSGAEQPGVSLSLALDPAHELERDLDQAVRAGLETYLAVRESGPFGSQQGDGRDDGNCNRIL